MPNLEVLKLLNCRNLDDDKLWKKALILGNDSVAGKGKGKDKGKHKGLRAGDEIVGWPGLKTLYEEGYWLRCVEEDLLPEEEGGAAGIRLRNLKTYKTDALVCPHTSYSQPVAVYTRYIALTTSILLAIWVMETNINSSSPTPSKPLSSASTAPSPTSPLSKTSKSPKASRATLPPCTQNKLYSTKGVTPRKWCRSAYWMRVSLETGQGG